MSATLIEHLRWLGTPGCVCLHTWKSLGKLHGVPMEKGWVRMSTNPMCPDHGSDPDAGTPGSSTFS